MNMISYGCAATHGYVLLLRVLTCGDDTMAISDIRRDYEGRGLEPAEMSADPVDQFRIWFDDAVKAELPDVNAMTLATADASGAPSARIVLLKDFGPEGFIFFTCYGSRKASDLRANPQAALMFYWQPLDRQVRIEGDVAHVSREASEAYFALRPHGAQISAVASAQSQVVDSRQTLEQIVADIKARYVDNDIPCPANWGGYRVSPRAFEFWLGRPNRLHDRVRYTRACDDSWQRERLAP